MATYIVLSKYTQQGIGKIKESPARIDAARQTARSMGAELKAWYLVMGRYDIVTIWEAPNDETIAKVMLAIGSLGNITTETLRAFTEDEFRQIVATLF
ncbi:MAG: GYD domain-containing protein [Anaerolineae bacterium]|jgi:uncharacterized protein with GYD domain